MNTAYGSEADDYADTGLAEPPKVNTAYGSDADSYADTGLEKGHKAVSGRVGKNPGQNGQVVV